MTFNSGYRLKVQLTRIADRSHVQWEKEKNQGRARISDLEIGWNCQLIEVGKTMRKRFVRKA